MAYIPKEKQHTAEGNQKKKKTFSLASTEMALAESTTMKALKISSASSTHFTRYARTASCKLVVSALLRTTLLPRLFNGRAGFGFTSSEVLSEAGRLLWSNSFFFPTMQGPYRNQKKAEWD
jgi:hypothetical protein